MPNYPQPLFPHVPKNASLNVTAPVVLRPAGGGRLGAIIVNNPGSSGSLVLNDCAALAGATAANQILSLTTAQLTSLQSKRACLRLNLPCLNGITVSQVPTGGQFSISFT
jgi:hypothetical protein